MILRCKRLAIPLSLVGVGGVGSSLASWGFFIFRFGCGTFFWSQSVLTFFPLNLSFIIFFFHSFGSSGHFVGVGSHTEGRLTHREAVHAPCEDVWLGLFLETRALLWSSTAVPTAPSPCHGEGQTLSRRSCLSGAIPRVPPCSHQLG